MAQLCTPWITGEDVAECCSVESTAGFEFDVVAGTASDLLFELSGRLFPGECEKTVRPACDECACGYQVLSRGHIIGPWDYGHAYSGLCGLCLTSCSPSRVKLSGYPVTAITEIKIDGDILASTNYRLWKSRYVTRLDDGRWPMRQNLTQPDTADGTFSISYTYGASPPAAGVSAAAQLACELYKACDDATSGSTGVCALPTGVTRITRQGVTIEKQAFTSWAFSGTWTTGMALVDGFLNTYNRAGLMRRPTFWAPGRHQYAQPFG